MQLEVLGYTPFPEMIIEKAGRTCYNSKMGDPSIIQKLIKAGHESVIEHASITFRVSGVSRTLTHQLVRHRIASFSQKSQRYVEDDFEYIIPETISKNDKLKKIYEKHIAQTLAIYKFLIDEGIKKEDARFVLPNASCSEIVFTMNFRALRNFLKLRLNERAQWEIRELAKKIRNEMKTIAPNVFFDF